VNTRLKSIHIVEIFVEDRFRKDYGAKEAGEHQSLESLKDSIQAHGLITPIAVVEEEEGYRLLAGGRRLQACKELNWKEIPAHIFPKTLTQIEHRSIELLENLDRKDLTWQETQALINDIDNLMKAQHGARTSGKNRAVDEDGVKTVRGTADTAKLLGVDPRTVYKAKELVQAMEILPEVKKAKTLSEAIKTTARIRAGTGQVMLEEENSEEAELATKLRTSVLTHFRTKPWKTDLKALESYNASLVILTKRVSPEDLEQVYDLMAPNSWLVYMPVLPRDEDLRELVKAGFSLGKDARAVFIWPSSAFVEPQQLQPNFSLFFYVRKGAAVLNKPGRSSVFSMKRVPLSLRAHEDEKPIEFWMEVISTFAAQGSRVLIPYSLEGNAILAAMNLTIPHTYGYDETSEFVSAFEKKVEIYPPMGYTSYPENVKVEDEG
jgi:ParB-like chromosome segregation protein Spo0J